MQANAFLIAARSSSVNVIKRLRASVSSDKPLMACATSGSSWDANTTSSILSKTSGSWLSSSRWLRREVTISTSRFSNIEVGYMLVTNMLQISAILP